MSSDGRATKTAQGRYDRVARFYDLSEALMEGARYGGWRALLWSKVEGERILEVGVDTGKNFPHYPPHREIVAVDFSPNMLERARAKRESHSVKVALNLMDVQDLAFPDDTFDSVVASFVFCSVPDPVLGLRELGRVLRPGGKAIFLEHVLSANPIIAWLMVAANPAVVRMMGANINRRTVENVERSGLVVEEVSDLWAGIFKLIEARKAR
jgi:ubiquinone/menaquinone biosynthesis C-methylase UbiE